MGPGIAAAVTAIFGIAVLGYVGVTDNGLIHSRNLAREGWSGIDVQLERRENLVETVKGSADHERATLEAVTRERRASVDGASTGGQAVADDFEIQDPTQRRAPAVDFGTRE